MKTLGVLVLNTLREQWRNRAFQVTLLFAAVMIYFSVLLGMLAGDQELRALMDFGLAFIELLGLAVAAYGAATNVLREMESKVIYLILSRPISRESYLLGRAAGLSLSALAAVAGMAAVHLSLLLLKGWHWQPAYLLAVAGVMLKLLVAVSLTTLLALSTTSPLSALTMTGIFWTLGHFTQELKFLLSKLSPAAAAPMGLVLRVIPDLELLNFRDRLEVPASLWSRAPLWLAAGYALVYSGAALVLSQWMIRRKDL